MREIILAALALSACAASPQPRPSPQLLPLHPQTVAGLDLRKSQGADAEPGPYFIHIESIATHHTSLQCSTLLKSTVQGHWIRSQLCQEGPGLLKVPVQKVLDTTRDLTAEQDKHIEEILASKELYQPQNITRNTGPPAIGAMFHLIEIRTTKGRATAEHHGNIPHGKAAELAAYILALPQ